MLLVSAKVGPFKSIDTAHTVQITDKVTVLVGMNEAGKTVFLQALLKSNDALGEAKFDPVEDYPRKDLPTYLKQHKIQPVAATTLIYQPNDKELNEINSQLGTDLQTGFTFTVTHKYNNYRTIDINVDEKPVLRFLMSSSTLSSDAKTAIQKAKSIRQIPDVLTDVSLTEEDEAFLTTIKQRIAKSDWDSVVMKEVWEVLSKRIPKFLYFSNYQLLPSKMNLADLATRVAESKTNPSRLEPKHRGVLALLRMADILIDEFTNTGGYEPLKAKIEGVSINLTDQIMNFWKQNEDLEVEVDIKPDPEDAAPFNAGPNLYLRIKNRRHRGVSTPFRQRSQGFIWFFSFLVWFDDVQQQLTKEDTQGGVILLLDEPGLSLHALAQQDFLRYIDELSDRHQVLYTTHSPFMVHSDRLNEVRVVEDRDKIGTVISDNLSSSDPRTLFPLQAALGYTIAQNLFISKRNLLVEGPSELIYLHALSAMLEGNGRIGLREDVTIVPTGGLDKVVTFVALLGASGLQLAVLHDFRGTPEQKLTDLVRQKLISAKAILDASQFRDLTKIGVSGSPSDIEDLFTPSIYLDYFNQAFSAVLGAAPVTEGALPAGDRIVNRIERYLDGQGIKTRLSGGFNHYTVASSFASNPTTALDADTLSRFEELFKAVNNLF